MEAHGEHIQPNVAKFGAALTCSGHLDQQRRLSVMVHFGNSVGQTLLRPAQVKVGIILNCAVPKRLVMGWVPGNRGESLPQKIEESSENIPTFRVSENARLLLRGVVLDRDDHMFFNFSSIAYKVSSSANNLGAIERLNGKIIDEISQDSYFLHRTVLFAEPGTFEIEGDCHAYFTDYNSERTGKGVGVKDKIRVVVVKKLEIHPPFQVIYYH